MSWLSYLFRKTLDEPSYDFSEANDIYLEEAVRRALNLDLYEHSIPSERNVSRRSGSGVDSPLRDTGAAFSPVAPVILNFGTSKHEGRN